MPAPSHNMTRGLKAAAEIGKRTAAHHAASQSTGRRVPPEVARYLLREDWTWETLLAPPAQPSPEQRILLRWWQGNQGDRGELLVDTAAGINWRARRAELTPERAAAYWAFIHRRAAHADCKRNPRD